MKKPSPTKERLNAHRGMLEKLATLRQELEYAEDAYGSIRSPDFSGMPRGSSDPSKSPMVEAVIRKIELEERIKRKEAEIAADWAELEPFIEQLQPIETLVMNLRYYYGAEWEGVCFNLYGKRRDYAIEVDRYMNRTFKIHGRALLTLSSLMEGNDGELRRTSVGTPKESQ